MTDDDPKSNAPDPKDGPTLDATPTDVSPPDVAPVDVSAVEIPATKPASVELRELTLAGLRDVAALAEEAGARTLASSLRGDRIRRLEEDRFHLVVLGEFNHGKTTFVNALLGAEVLPAGVTPTTALVHRIVHAEGHAAKVVRDDGSESEVSFAQLEDYEASGGADRSHVQHLEVGYPAAILEEGVVLVDTPGVNDLNEARAEITYGYIPRADAILFLLDAGQILKESERQFVSKRLTDHAKDKVLFVVNKMDLLDDEEKQEALAYARMNLAKLLENPKVFGLSAEQALEGAREESGLEELITELRRFLQDERGRVLLDNALVAGLRTVATLETGLGIQRRALQMESDELERRLKTLEQDLEGSKERLVARTRQVRESVAAVKALVRQDVDAFARRFAEQLPQEIDAADAKDLQRYLPGFVEDRLSEFAEREAQDIAIRLEKVAEEAIAFVSDDASAQVSRLKAALGDDAPHLELDVNTFAYDVGVFAVGAFGVTLMMLSNVLVGGALAVAAPVLAVFFRGRAETRLKEQAKAKAPEVVSEVATLLKTNFDARIEEFGERLVNFVTQANEEMTRSIAELVQTAREAKASGEDTRDAQLTITGTNLARLADAKHRLSSLKKELWANGKGH